MRTAPAKPAPLPEKSLEKRAETKSAPKTKPVAPNSVQDQKNKGAAEGTASPAESATVAAVSAQADEQRRNLEARQNAAEEAPKAAANPSAKPSAEAALLPKEVLWAAVALLLVGAILMPFAARNQDVRTASSVVFSLGAGGIAGAFGWGGLDLSGNEGQKAGFGMGIGAAIAVFLVTLALFHRDFLKEIFAGIRDVRSTRSSGQSTMSSGGGPP